MEEDSAGFVRHNPDRLAKVLLGWYAAMKLEQKS
jgi:hypothetical protein